MLMNPPSSKLSSCFWPTLSSMPSQLLDSRPVMYERNNMTKNDRANLPLILAVTTLLTTLSLTLITSTAFGWGRVGHDLSSRVAAHLVAKTTDKSFFRTRAFDLGYYSNVPDLVWKKPGTYEVEWLNHFMDLEIFERELKKALEEGKISPKDDPFDWERGKFDAKFPSVPKTAGRAYWRIRELEKRLAATASLLKQKDVLKEERHRLQSEWLIVAGVLGHYVTDLAQPLHVTENFDGQLTEQKGVHAHFEDSLVDSLWPSLDMQVFKEADRLWAKDANILAGKTSLSLIRELANSSAKEVEELLKRDKKLSRDDLKKGGEAFRPLLVKRLAAGAVTLAEIWRRHANWSANEDKFFSFTGEPAYIEAPIDLPVPTPTPSKK